jgi:flagellar biosynthesis anti-sigma factor FlgM
MRIDSTQTPQPLHEGGRTGSPSPASTDGRASAGGALGEDSAQLSSTHVQLQALVAQALQFPEVRHDKVNALRQLVVGGSYQPSAKQVAESVFAHMLVTPAA